MMNGFSHVSVRQMKGVDIPESRIFCTVSFKKGNFHALWLLAPGFMPCMFNRMHPEMSSFKLDVDGSAALEDLMFGTFLDPAENSNFLLASSPYAFVAVGLVYHVRCQQ